MKANAVAFILLATAASNGSSATLDHSSVTLAFEYGHGLAENRAVATRTTLGTEFSVALANGWALEGAGQFVHDPARSLRPQAYDDREFAGARAINRPLDVTGSGSVDVRELYLRWDGAAASFRLGKLQTVWGKLDGLRILDAVNPYSFHEFILGDDADRRLSQWSTQLDMQLGDWLVESVWVADGTVHDVPDSGEWFAFQAPRFRFGQRGQNASTPSVTTVLPKTLRDDTYGVRLSRFLGDSEWSLVALRGNSFEAIGEIEQAPSERPNLIRRHHRRSTLGIGWETGLGGVVFRGELAWIPDDRFNAVEQGQLTQAASDRWMLGLGIDANLPLNTFANFQVLVDRLADPIPGLIRPKSDTIATITLRRSFWYEDLDLELRWFRDLRIDDHYLQFTAQYAFSDAMTLQLRATSFAGSDIGIFGQYEERDLITVGFQYRF